MLLSYSYTLISKICVNDFLVLQRGKGNDGRGWKRGRIRGRGYSTGSKRGKGMIEGGWQRERIRGRGYSAGSKRGKGMIEGGVAKGKDKGKGVQYRV